MKIAYLTTCFGTQSHTFIRREIRALRALGLDLALLGIRQDKDHCAADAKDLVAQTHYLYPLNPIQTILYNLQLFVCGPLHYISGAWGALTSEEFSVQRRLKMLYHYFVAAALVKPVREAGITHIHAHFMNVSASVAMYTAHHARVPFSITVHSAGTYKTPHILGVKQKLKQASVLLMISHYNIRYFDKIQPCATKSHVVRCGMNLEEFHYQAPEMPANHSPLRLLSVGRFVEKKGFGTLLEAAKLLKERRVDFKLTLIGDGPLYSALKAQAAQNNLQNEVQFAGKKDTAEVHAAMTGSDIVIVPSVTSTTGEMEGLPVVIMEAMALGTAVVATEHSGIPEIVKPGQTGALAPERDADALAEQIMLLAARQDNAILAAATALVEKEFNIEHVARQRLEIFNSAHQKA